MKRLTITLVLILSSLMSFSQTKDSDGHTLVSLWKPYYKAVDADKPQDQAKALEAIKQEAVSKHLAWDFYDAASRYVQVGEAERCFRERNRRPCRTHSGVLSPSLFYGLTSRSICL